VGFEKKTPNQGAAEKIKRETDVHLRQLGRFSARGVRKHGEKN
jgi:hypothetical protein